MAVAGPGVAVEVEVGLGVLVLLGVGVPVAVQVWEAVALGVAVALAVSEAVGVSLGVSVAVPVAVAVAVAVGVNVRDGVRLGRGEGGRIELSVAEIVSRSAVPSAVDCCACVSGGIEVGGRRLRFSTMEASVDPIEADGSPNMAWEVTTSPQNVTANTTGMTIKPINSVRRRPRPPDRAKPTGLFRAGLPDLSFPMAVPPPFLFRPPF